MADQPIQEPDRSYHVLDDPVVYPVVLIGVLLTTGLPIFLGQRICLPVLNGLVIFPLFAWALRVGRPRRAVELALFWVVCQGSAVVAASLLLPDRAGYAIVQGLEYRTEILRWAATGQGRASQPAIWLPGQARDLALFSLATLLTGGLGGLIWLASRLNAFNFSVTGLWQQAASPLLILLAWPIWAVVRLIGYLVMGAALAEPVAVLDLRPAWWARWWRQRRRWLALGLAFILLGAAMQLLLARYWPGWLRAVTRQW